MNRHFGAFSMTHASTKALAWMQIGDNAMCNAQAGATPPQIPDPDPVETAEWREALDSL
ncbi:hypothetical protein L489_4018, partial [Bordetella bronchiseptica 00-P-2730]